MSGAVAVMMGGGGGVVVPLPGGTCTETQFDPTNATAGWRFQTDGTVDTRNQASYAAAHDWFKSSGGTPGNSYWIKSVSTGEATAGSANNTVLALSADQEWRIVTNAVESISSSLAITIYSDSGGTNVVSTGTYTLNADRDL